MLWRPKIKFEMYSLNFSGAHSLQTFFVHFSYWDGMEKFHYRWRFNSGILSLPPLFWISVLKSKSLASLRCHTGNGWKINYILLLQKASSLGHKCFHYSRWKDCSNFCSFGATVFLCHNRTHLYNPSYLNIVFV